jgi:uncharacterized protein (DUF697 family)/tellurite resistance protein
MNAQDAETIIAIAALAAIADGNQNDSEQASVASAAARLGFAGAEALTRRAASGSLDLAALCAQLTDDEVRHAAYETASAVCRADGELNARETAFLADLERALGVTAGEGHPGAPGAEVVEVSATASGGAPRGGDMDTFILDQAMLTAACEILPDRLASMAILPLQLRLVYSIGQKHGQALDLSQAKDLAAALGIGAAAQVMESVVRRSLGGIAGGLLGGLLGGAAGVASGMAVTFAASYALGHAADQYYAQGRQLSSADLKALFTRFQRDAQDIYPRVEQRIRTLATTADIGSLLRGQHA